MSMRRLLFLLILGIGIGIGTLLFGYREATSMPRIRSAEIRLAGWPRGAGAVTAVLLSDIHVGGPDMPPERLRRIVGQINRLAPDLVLIAGDFVSDKRSATRKYSIREAVAPLRDLASRAKVIAVLGNHDHWRDAPAMRAQFEALGVVVLDNQVVEAGPLAIGGIDDDFTGHADSNTTVAALRRLHGAKLLLSHSPDPFHDLPDDVGLMLAGHTHCGQIVMPLVGPLATFSRFGPKYRCGVIREGRRALIVTAGMGTSIVPLRIGAPPDLWLLRLSGVHRE